MDPIELIRLLRIIGYAAIAPAILLTLWMILFAVKHPPQKIEKEKTVKKEKEKKTVEPREPAPAPTVPVEVPKSVKCRRPDAVKEIDAIWNQTPTAGAGWEGSPLWSDKEGGLA